MLSVAYQFDGNMYYQFAVGRRP